MKSEKEVISNQSDSNLKGWRQISCGARKGMWRYSGPEGTILLADGSHPSSIDLKTLFGVAAAMERLGRRQSKFRAQHGKWWMQQAGKGNTQ